MSATERTTTERTPTATPSRNPPYALRTLLDRPELTRAPAALIPGVAYSGRVTLLSAREKAGKSTLVGQGVAAFSRGGDFLNESLNRGRVLWYPIDEPAGDTVRRLHSYGADLDGVVIQTERPNAAEMREEIHASHANIVVIDTLGELWNGLIRSARDAEEVGPFLRPFVVAARESNTAMVLLHHTSKAGQEYRDSVQIGASVDIVLTLRMPGIKSEAEGGEWDTGREDDGRRVLDGRGRGGVNVKMRLAFDGTCYSMGDAPMPLRGRILNELNRSPASGNSLVTMLRAKRDAVLAELRSMLDEGLVVKTREGGKELYALLGGVVPVQKPLSLSREPLTPRVIVTPSRPVSNTQTGAFLAGSQHEQKNRAGTTSGTTPRGVA